MVVVYDEGMGMADGSVTVRAVGSPIGQVIRVVLGIDIAV